MAGCGSRASTEQPISERSIAIEIYVEVFRIAAWNLRKISRLIGAKTIMTDVKRGKLLLDFVERVGWEELFVGFAAAKGAVVAAFFKISCPVCQFTFPFLERLYQRYGGDDITFLGISQDDANATAGFTRQYGVTFPLALDEKANGYPASNAYGSRVFLRFPD